MLHTRSLFLLISFILGTWTIATSQVTADFTVNRTTDCGSLQAAFTDQSTSTAGTITNWSWDLGGVSSSNQNPGRIFGTPGMFEICLTATDDQGNSDTNCKVDYIQVFQNPTPLFSLSQFNGCPPFEVEFNDLSQSIDGAITNWIWGIGGTAGVVVDDGTLTGISSTYDLAGSYSVSLTIRDENNCEGSLTQSNLITVFPDPEIMIAADDTFGCDLPFVVNFSNLNSEPNVIYQWDFGNGETFTGPNPPTVEYQVAGSYDIQVIAQNIVTNCVDTLIREEYIQVGIPGGFSFTPEFGCQELTVDFTDNSEGLVDSILWDFGDGNMSTSVDPSHTYLLPGCYTPSLTRYIAGCPTTLSAPDCIIVFSLPVANYSSDESEACELPHTVNFTNLSSNAVSYLWDFGDGNTSTAFSPSNTYELFGEYPVTLTAMDANGCMTSVVVDTIRIAETAAALAFEVLWGCTPLQVVLDESSNTVGSIVSWNWEIEFEDGTDIFNSGQENPMLTLVDTGFYDVTLTVTNSLGCTSMATFEDALGVGIEPVVDFIATPLQTCVNSPVNFTDLSSSYGDFWIWDFGDGVIVEDVQNPTHEYLDTGFFDVTLLVFNNGCGEAITFENYIYVSSPIGKPAFVLDCVDPFTVEFTNVSIGADSVFWEFDVEGNTTDTTSVFIPMHTYPDTGCYFVAHTAFNFESGCIDYDTLQLCLTNPIADFQLGPTEGCAPLTVTVEDLSVFATSYQWIVNGGIVSDTTAAAPSIVFEEPGVYSNIRLVITDVNDCQDTVDYNGLINVNGVEANFTPTPMGGCFPLSVSFSDNSTSLFGNIVQWEWVIGDTLFTTSDPQFMYTFDTVGIFPVSLTVMNEDGCIGTILEAEAVEVTLPIADFAADTVSCTADIVQFLDLSQGTNLTYLWDFGDNSTSTEAAPAHNYADQGTYSVCLTITDPYGCDSTICKVDYIQIANPIANFTVDSTAADCPELIVQFENQSINASSYEWNFGDDSGPSNLENPPHVYTLPGVFDVSLIAIATENCRDTVLLEDFILLDGPIGEFEFTIDTSCVPLQVGFAGMSDKLYDFIWDFGNGDLDSTLTVEMDTTNYIYTEVGAYVPKLILIDDSGCKVAYESPDTIYVEDLELNFITSDTILCSDLAETSFINLSSSTAPITFTEWNLEGIDPPVTNEFSPNVNYIDPGNYDVSLILANPYCRDTLLKENYITVGATPIADFELSDTMGCTPVTVNFSDMSLISEGAIISWAWDFGDSTSANIRNPQHIYTEAGTYEVSLSISTEVGCTDVFTRTIEVLPLPLVELTNSLIACQGEVVELNALLVGDTTGLIYSWLPSPSLSCTDCLDPLASPLDTTTYYFTLASPNGCVDTNEVVVNVRPFPVPIVEISNDTLICANDNVQLVAGGGDNVFSYQWDPSRPGLTCYESCFNPIAFPPSATTYVVTVTNVHGCSAKDSVLVDVIDQSQAIAGPDRTICLGDSVELQVDFGMEITWLNPTYLTCTYCPDPIASPPADKDFRVSAITDIGCEILDTITVFVLEPDDIDAGPDQVICVGEPTQLEGSGVGVISWSPLDDLDDANTINPFASPLFSTSYLLTIVNDLCLLTDSVFVEVVEETTINANDVTICAGDTIQLSVDGTADLFNWLPPTNLSNAEIANPFAWPSETTTYEILGQLAACSQGTAEVTVLVESLPVVSLPAVHRFFPGQIVEMATIILSEGNYEFAWSGSDILSCTNCPNPSIAPDTNGVFNLIVTDLDNGCELILETRLELLVDCPDDLLAVPNAFSPNEDNNNDLLKVITSIPRINTFKIFNRWGALVYAGDDKFEGWDGMLDGTIAPIGVYVYYVEAPCPIDPTQTIFKKGDITLFR